MTGPISSWHVTSTGASGYVVDRLQWRRHLGSYKISVTLSASGPVNVEIWNDNGEVLLARRHLPATRGVETITVPLVAAGAYVEHVFGGWGPFRADFAKPPRGQRLELRVWSPGHETVNVYSASLHNGPSADRTAS